MFTSNLKERRRQSTNSAGKIAVMAAKQDPFVDVLFGSTSMIGSKAHSANEMDSRSCSSNGILEESDFAKDTGIFNLADMAHKTATPDSGKRVRRNSLDELDIQGSSQNKKLFNPALFRSKTYQKVKEQVQSSESRQNHIGFSPSSLLDGTIPKVGNKRKIDSISGKIEGTFTNEADELIGSPSNKY